MTKIDVYDSLRPYISRVLATLLAAWLMHLASKYSFVVPENLPHEIVDVILTIIGIMLGVFSIAHKAIDKKVNPGDAASKHIAVEERRESTELKSIADTKEQPLP